MNHITNGSASSLKMHHWGHRLTIEDGGGGGVVSIVGSKKKGGGGHDVPYLIGQ